MTTPKWLDLKISIGNILSVLTIIVGLTACYFTIIGNVASNAREIGNLDHRLTKAENSLSVLSDALTSDRLALATSLTQLQSDVSYMRVAIDDLKRKP